MWHSYWMPSAERAVMRELELLCNAILLSHLPEPELQVIGCWNLSVRVSSLWAATENLCQLSVPAHAAQLENLGHPTL